MSSQEEADKINEFTGISGANEERARFFLQAANWDLMLALSQFYEADASEMDDVEVVHESAVGGVVNVKPTPKEPSQANKKDAKFGTIRADANNSDGDSDSDDDEGQAFYVGGSDTSGQQVLGPKRDKKPGDIVNNLFKKAKEHGAEEVEPEEIGKRSARGPAAFQGQGFRLGHDATPQQSASPAATAVRPPGGTSQGRSEPVVIVITFWANGFTIGDGPLRDYHDPASRDIIASLKERRTPAELLTMYPGKEVTVDMHGRHNEEYQQPKKVIKPFTGTGNVLGDSESSGVTEIRPAGAVASVKIPSTQPTSAQTGATANAQTFVNLNEAEPITQLQIRLEDGTALRLRFNHSHKVADVRSVINRFRPEYAAQEYGLVTTFPTKELNDNEQTLVDAGLLNATVMQKKKN